MNFISPNICFVLPLKDVEGFGVSISFLLPDGIEQMDLNYPVYGLLHTCRDQPIFVLYISTGTSPIGDASASSSLFPFFYFLDNCASYY